MFYFLACASYHLDMMRSRVTQYVYFLLWTTFVASTALHTMCEMEYTSTQPIPPTRLEKYVVLVLQAMYDSKFWAALHCNIQNTTAHIVVHDWSRRLPDSVPNHRSGAQHTHMGFLCSSPLQETEFIGTSDRTVHYLMTVVASLRKYDINRYLFVGS